MNGGCANISLSKATKSTRELLKCSGCVFYPVCFFLNLYKKLNVKTTGCVFLRGVMRQTGVTANCAIYTNNLSHGEHKTLTDPCLQKKCWQLADSVVAVSLVLSRNSKENKSLPSESIWGGRQVPNERQTLRSPLNQGGWTGVCFIIQPTSISGQSQWTQQQSDSGFTNRELTRELLGAEDSSTLCISQGTKKQKETTVPTLAVTLVAVHNIFDALSQ